MGELKKKLREIDGATRRKRESGEWRKRGGRRYKIKRRQDRERGRMREGQKEGEERQRDR